MDQENIEQIADSNSNDAITKKRKTLKNILIVSISNLMTALAGILASFLIPKIMQEYDYAYYKTFTLYTSYIGVLHFGICDGIYLKYAGSDYNQLDSGKFGAFTRFFFIVETLISSITILLSLFFLHGYYRIVILLVGINIWAVNVTTYFELLSQATSRFKLVSMRNIIRAFSSIFSVVALVVFYYYFNFNVQYYIYSSIVVGINIVLSLWYIITYRKIVFNFSEKILPHLKEIKTFYSVGIILLLSNFIAQMIFIADQQCVKILFSDLDFGQYSFAYTMVNLLIIATTAVSVVLYPSLSKSTVDDVREKYSILNAYMLMFMCLSILIYFPLHIFVSSFLEKYTSSLVIFRIILPGFVISASITIIQANYYKKFNHIARFLLFSLIILALSVLANLFAYLLFESMISISIASIIIHLVWYIVSEQYLVIKYKVSWIKNFIFMIVTLSAYYLLFLVDNIILSGILYLLILIVLSILFYKKELKNALIIILKKKTKDKEIYDN